MNKPRWKIAGINFDHFHMGDLLRMAAEHPQVEVVGLHDAQRPRVQAVTQRLGLSDSLIYDNDQQLMEKTKPDLVILCPAAADHAHWVERIAPFGVPMMVEKPFAASLDEADRMIAAAAKHRTWLAINWPLMWSPVHRTSYDLAVRQGRIGEIIGVHYCGGNRGPLWHSFDKIERTAAEVEAEKPNSWFYKRSAGGGSLLDYLGYGATLGTWFMGNQKPLSVTSVVHQPPGLEVDEHSVTICRYAKGLSHMETRWGTFTDPWTHQTQPMCGFTLIGTEGTIHSPDYSKSVRVQDRRHPEGVEEPVALLHAPTSNPIEYLLHCLETGEQISGPLSVEVSRIGQQIVDTAFRSAQEGRTLSLIG